MAKPSGRRTSQFSLPSGQPQPQVPSVQNNFTGGFKTEFTGLNFPENAATASNNCTFTRVGNITRRNGFDYESNFTTQTLDRTNHAISTFLWENAGGDGNTVLYVAQVGNTLSFYNVTAATTSAPLSDQLLVSTVNLSSFQISPSSAVECQYTSGNGYLFVFHPNCDPFYCSYSSGTIAAAVITIQMRDFIGVSPEPGNPPDTFRPTALTTEHQYNLQNQGWTSASTWTATSSSIVAQISAGPVWVMPISLVTFTVASGIVGITVGQSVNWTSTGNQAGIGLAINLSGTGLVNSYSGTTLVLNVTSSSAFPAASATLSSETTTISPPTAGQITTWHSAIGNYPSNADVWWTFKNASDVFDPTTTIGNVTLSSPAPKGSYILNAFTQQRSGVSGITGITDVTTLSRPKTGAWYQGRVWYAGVDASFGAIGDEPFSTWTENIYFSQIAVSAKQFGLCYQTNDPTSETLFDLLPTDGGVITIQGSGSIYKLFPVVNGLLVFAANGIWFITGNQGLGFTADDFTVSKLSGEHALSGSSFISMVGYPIFWNADGIYTVMPGVSQTSGQRSLEVKNLTLSTIKQFYNNIPLSSKKLAKGSYNHITGVVQWVYKSTEATSVTDSYSFDSILNFLTYTEAFYNWTMPNAGTASNPYIHAINYIEGPGGLNVTPPLFKYLTSSFTSGVYKFTLSEEKDNVNWVDFTSSVTGAVSYTSSFTTGYSLKGQALRKFQPQYVYFYSEIPAYVFGVEGIWGYAATPASNQFSTRQIITVNKSTAFNKDIRRVRIRGNGYVLQLKIDSVPGKPFNLAGWAILDVVGIS